MVLDVMFICSANGQIIATKLILLIISTSKVLVLRFARVQRWQGHGSCIKCIPCNCSCKDLSHHANSPGVNSPENHLCLT